MNRHITSIIMPMHNQLEYSKMAVETLYKNTNKEEFELICIDDASTDGTSEYLDGLEGVHVIHFKENVGFDRGVNAGIKVAKGEYTAILNNDLLLTPYWLPQLITVLESDSHIGIVVPACNSSSNCQTISVSYKNNMELDAFARVYNHTEPMRWQERIRLIFYAALFRTRELKAFGGLDERFSPGGFEDDDLSLRYRRAGYRLIFTTDTFIHHFGSVTMSKAGQNLLINNRKIFYEKHQIDAWELGDMVIPFVISYDYPVRCEPKILGVGSRAGATLQYLKAMYMEKRRIVPVIDYLCKNQSYMEDAVTICNHVAGYEDRMAFLSADVPKYDVVVFEEVIKNEELQSLLKEYESAVKPDGDLLFLFQKDENITQEHKGYQLRYKKEIAENLVCVFTRSVEET